MHPTWIADLDLKPRACVVNNKDIHLQRGVFASLVSLLTEQYQSCRENMTIL